MLWDKNLKKFRNRCFVFKHRGYEFYKAELVIILGCIQTQIWFCTGNM